LYSEKNCERNYINKELNPFASHFENIFPRDIVFYFLKAAFFFLFLLSFLISVYEKSH
jgi:hypothetical protein